MRAGAGRVSRRLDAPGSALPNAEYGPADPPASRGAPPAAGTTHTQAWMYARLISSHASGRIGNQKPPAFRADPAAYTSTWDLSPSRNLRGLPPPRISGPCAIVLPDMVPPSSSVQPSMIIESDMEHPDMRHPSPTETSGPGADELIWQPSPTRTGPSSLQSSDARAPRPDAGSEHEPVGVDDVFRTLCVYFLSYGARSTSRAAPESTLIDAGNTVTERGGPGAVREHFAQCRGQ